MPGVANNHQKPGRDKEEDFSEHSVAHALNLMISFDFMFFLAPVSYWFSLKRTYLQAFHNLSPFFMAADFFVPSAFSLAYRSIYTTEVLIPRRQQAAKTSNSASSPPSMETSKAGTVRNERVVNCLYQNPDALFRLICFPWAGGGSIYFAKWGHKMNNFVEVHSIRLAGRETRAEEPFTSDMQQVVDEIVCALLPILQDKPFAFFGHSLGALIAFKTALHLKEKYKQEPVHIFVSSITPPHLKAQYHKAGEEELTEEQILQYIKDFGGTSKNIIEDKELSKQYITKVMADANLFNNFNFDAPPEAVLSCDLTCFTGSEDIAKDIKAWKDVTSGSFNSHVLPGNHFYLMEPANETFIKNYIIQCLELWMLAYS
ncbi:PREDICTED: S-acyl fatty acid synthase thioesterase, medium chain [Condylura cristata]|uniref:S-acyl fatty acid synthase thioesterase, medium chain n=1 Tax=Condylura cristata TaxID=143302 RepID=UPI0003346CE9|nr:PREDICTED: S-acyl fatty acid synthase thioesterase, medium chain [Condylura cristata]